MALWLDNSSTVPGNLKAEGALAQTLVPKGTAALRGVQPRERRVFIPFPAWVCRWWEVGEVTDDEAESVG